MCGGQENVQTTQSPPPSPSSSEESKHITKNMNHLTIETEDSFSSLLELAANNDLDGFKRSLQRDASSIDEIGLWYGRQMGSNQMILEHRTPLMVASTYGSIDVLKLILSLSEADINRSCGLDKSTALHCATSGGSVNAVDAVKLLLLHGADPNSLDANGHRPLDVIFVSPKFPNLKKSMKELLNNLRLSSVSLSPNSYSPPLSSSPPDNESLSSTSDLSIPSLPEKKEYPIDPSLPDIKNSIYSSDEFRMFSFKIRPCSRAYSHDWTECPFVHPGENARRRDPRKFHYSCVPCPDFRKGACRRGDICEYAHGVFECWLHPAQYRTRLCKDGTSCMRRVCFFAHTSEELRPLYVSTGSAVPSPRSSSASNAMDMAVAMSLLPGSPSSQFTPPMSPSSNGLSLTQSSFAFSQPNVPSLHLPAINLQSSRLRSSFNARDFEEFNMLQDFEAQKQHQLFNDLSCFSVSQPRIGSSSINRPARLKAPTSSNLDELFSAEFSSSPRFSDQSMASSVFSPSHKSLVLNQFQQKQIFSPKNGDHPLFQASFGMASSPGRLSPCNLDPLSPMNSRQSSFTRSPVNSLSNWGSPNRKLGSVVQGDEMGCFQKMSSLELENNGEEPDFSWVQSLVKESPPEVKEKLSNSTSIVSSSGEVSNPNSQIEAIDHSVLGTWIEQMQLDQLVA